MTDSQTGLQARTTWPAETVARKTARQVRIVLACLVIIGATTNQAIAYQAIGPGTLSCGTWTADRGRPETAVANMNEAWVLGFLTAIGWVGQDGDDPLQGVDANAVAAWIDNYCSANPLDEIVQAAIKFYQAHPQ